MRELQKVFHELKEIVAQHRPGDRLPRPPSLHSISIHGADVSYFSAGAETDPERPPVILVHGFGGFFMDWPRVIASLERHTRVYAIDLPGWGFSDAQGGARALEDEVKVLHQFMVKLGLNKVILCGLSYGAGLVWAAGALQLSRVAHSVLLNPMPPFPLRYMHSPLYRSIFSLNRLQTIGALGHRLLNKSQYKMICRENLLNERLLDTFYLNLAYLVIKQPKIPFMLHAHALGAGTINWQCWENRMHGIRTPVTIMQGKQDRIFSLQSARYLQRLIPGSELIEVDECGHAMIFDQHRKVSEFLIGLVHRLAPSESGIGGRSGPMEKDLFRK